MGAAPTGEQRWTAILSTDMVGFTQITQQIGHEKVYDLLRHVIDIAHETVETHGGHVIDTAGDGILAAFGAPKALENASVQGCAAADDFRKRMVSERPALLERFGVSPAFRTGIAGGNIMVAHESETSFKVVGDPVNQAARLQALANPDEVLLTDAIQREAEGYVSTVDRGNAQIKGFDTPIQIHALSEMLSAVIRFDGSRRRGIVDLVSRQDELETALAVLSQNGPEKILAIVGVPGVGKSRLTHEIVSLIDEGRPVYLGQCAPNGQSLLSPLYDILRQASGTDGNREDVLRNLEEMEPGICDHKSLTEVAKQPKHDDDLLGRALQERELLASLLRGLCERRNAVYVIEDVHWIDSGTSDVLAGLVDSPLPIIVTSRPTHLPKWYSAPTVERIDLAPLQEDAIREIVAARFNDFIAPPLSEMIIQRSEGIPLIAEEISRALLYGDQLIETKDGLDLAHADATLVSGNLEHLVLSRVDTLNPDQKAILQTAAAIGRDFSEDLLEQATGRKTALADLADVIEENGIGRWRFAHALVRDAVYDSLLSVQREQVHFSIGTALENANDTNFSRLADHFAKANNPKKAVQYLILSAKHDLGLYALSDVVKSLDKAMGFIEREPTIVDEKTFGELASIWLRALDNAGNFKSVEAVYKRVLPRLSESGYSQQLSLAQTFYAIALTHLREYKQSETLASETLDAAIAADDPLAAAWAKVALMRIYEETYWKPPSFIEKLAHEIKPVAANFKDRHLAMNGLYLLSAMYRSSGQRTKAFAVAEEIAAFADTHKDRRARSFASWALALIYTTEGNPEDAEKAITEGRKNAIPGTADNNVFTGIETFNKVFLDPPDVARMRLDQADPFYETLGDANLIQSSKWVRSVLDFKSGNIARAWALTEELVPEVAAAGNVNLIRQVHLFRAEVLSTIAGLIDPESEAPPDRPTFQRAKPGVMDIVTLIKLRLISKRLATKDYEKTIALDPLKYGAHFARAKIGLGLIAGSRRQPDAALRLLEEGYESARKENLTMLIGRAEKALVALRQAT